MVKRLKWLKVKEFVVYRYATMVQVYKCLNYEMPKYLTDLFGDGLLFSFFRLQMCGFPINMQQCDLENMADEVFATGVHKLETSNVEFALAVHIHPYPNMVLSIWIYVASLVRKR